MTGRTCGNIVQTNAQPAAVPMATATYIGVDGPLGTVIAKQGDSGGPWYVGNVAYGTSVASNEQNYAVYMAIDYISRLGLDVIVN